MILFMYAEFLTLNYKIKVSVNQSALGKELFWPTGREFEKALDL